MEKIRFETARLIVRDMTNDDCDLVALSWGSPEVGRYMLDPYYENGDQLRQMVTDDELSKHEDWTDEFYFVTTDKESGELNGTACAWLMEDDVWGIGYTINYQWWNQGLATELIHGLEHFIRLQGGKTVSSEIAKANIASLKACYKNGFKDYQETRFQKSGTSIVYDALELRKEL